MLLRRLCLDERRQSWSARVYLTGAAPERSIPDGPDLAQRTVLRAALAKVPAALPVTAAGDRYRAADRPA
ncbi:MAG: hypothetical protein GEV12_18040, partial [Micromonosporaceae bacterium]|nr:hypothetical protein [Micromonosporaceae bacterium]